MQLIQFKPNEPQELTLGSETTDNRILHLGEKTAQSLADLKLEAGESFRVCLHQTAAELSFWSVWLSPATEQKRAEAETSELEKQLALSLEAATAGRKLPLAATGTEGGGVLPFAVAKRASVGRKTANGGIPYNVAFREILQVVTSGLRDEGLAWNDQAVQDAVCTLFISAGKAGWLTVWDREAAA